ncbi:hypothetical protein [Telluribacter humicola]|uniref:hypothetical protein n=1 Tax=Telluribacter humicola TaxID=1720261 RepID=UPI001A959313|nr:hypothetical protein [Telluribacter humicola]
MRKTILFLLLGLITHLASAQCKDYTDQLTGEVSRGGMIWITPQVEAINLTYVGDSLQLVYINPNIRDFTMSVRRGQRAILKTSRGLDTLYINKDYDNSPTTGLVATYTMDKDLSRYQNLSMIRVNVGSTHYDVTLKPRHTSQWNQLLGCILTKPTR